MRKHGSTWRVRESERKHGSTCLVCGVARRGACCEVKVCSGSPASWLSSPSRTHARTHAHAHTRTHARVHTHTDGNHRVNRRVNHHHLMHTNTHTYTHGQWSCFQSTTRRSSKWQQGSRSNCGIRVLREALPGGRRSRVRSRLWLRGKGVSAMLLLLGCQVRESARATDRERERVRGTETYRTKERER